ncbi:MAG: FAD-dependent oxidoreductase [Rhodospirillaceae bacterium]|nr:FAD-dependent oxidoreductase [Rhodospirillaceae bacterium]
MKVTSFPKNDHSNGWYNGLGDQPPASVLHGDSTADWVVVGGGFSGLAAARRLGELRPDDRVVLLEAGRIGENASGRNSGFVIDLPHAISQEQPEHDHRQIRVNRMAIAWLAELIEQHQIRCQWSHRGKVHVAATNRGRRNLEVMASRLGGLGEVHELWDAARLKTYLGTDYFNFGLFTPGCILMQPAALVTGLARSMPENVEVYEDSAVVAFDDGPSKILTTAGGSVTTPQVVLSTNGWTPGFGFLKHQLLTMHTFASLTRPLTESEQVALGGEGDWGTIPSTLGATTMRYTQDKRLLIRRSLRHRPDFTIRPDDHDSIRREHEETLKKRFPMVPDVGFEDTWGGVLCMSRNHVPKCGALADGIWAAVCQNGVGAAKGTISGRAVAELAAGEDTDLVADMTAYEDLQRFPPSWITAPVFRAKIAYARLTAGAEA